LRSQADDQRLHLDVRVDAHHRDVDVARRPRFVLRVHFARELVDRPEASLAEQPPHLLEVIVASLHHEVEDVLQLRGAERPALTPVLGAGLEVEERVGAEVIEPCGPELGVVGCLGRVGWIEVALEALEVTDSPRARRAVRAIDAALEVISLAGHVPVADVDHMQDGQRVVLETPAGGPPQEHAERPVRDRLRPFRIGAVAGCTNVEVARPEQHLRHDRVGQPQPGVAVEEEVVLEALRDQDEARMFLTAVGGCHQ
jgi:hypothetical protein